MSVFKFVRIQCYAVLVIKIASEAPQGLRAFARVFGILISRLISF